MSMTENEAKEWIEYLGNKNLPYDRSPISRKLACDIAIQALEEVQAYRAIGTVEELKTAMLYVSLAKIHGTVGRAIDACAEYESIGTIEEFKALKEKNEPKKIKGKRFVEAICPRCESELFETYWAFGGIHYCSNCEQKLDWSE